MKAGLHALSLAIHGWKRGFSFAILFNLLSYLALSTILPVWANDKDSEVGPPKGIDKIEATASEKGSDDKALKSEEVPDNKSKMPVRSEAEQDKEKPPPPLLGTPSLDSQKSSSPAPKLHRVQMRLSGSTCLSCLMELEKKFRTFAGVTKVKIEPPGQNYYRYYGAPGAAFSEATIIYDSSVIALKEMTDFVKFQGYQPFKIVDKPTN